MTNLVRFIVLIAVLPVISTSMISSPAQAQSAPTGSAAWFVPDPDKLPHDARGQAVRRGRDLIVRTSTLIGPDAADPAKRFAGNGLDCQSCHLKAGTQQFALPLAGIWSAYPQFNARENAVRTLEQEINGCMERSMNGRALPVDGPEMKAILAYIRFIGGAARAGRGTPALPLPDRPADLTNGRAVFEAVCVACHGPDGLGFRSGPSDAKVLGRRYRFPPLWGPDSYNDGAGMARGITAAQFVNANMPFGATFAAPVLSDSDAIDVAAFINSQPRPHMSGLEDDFPDRLRKPVDAAYPPFVGPFPPEQHRLGPWPPIQAWQSGKAHTD